MQLMTATDDSPRMLRLASQFLLDAAQLMEAELANGAPLMPAAPGPTVDVEAPTAAEAFAKVPVGTVVEVINKWAPNETDAALAAAAARIDAGGAGQGPTSFEALQPVIPAPPTVVTATDVPGRAAPLMTATLDKDGLPHDPRIHSVTPTITTAGVWRRRRNLDHATLTAVEAELRAARGSLPAAPVIPPPPPVVAAPNAPAAPVIPPPPPNVLTAPVAPAETTIDPFRQLMRRIDGLTGEGGRLSPELAKPIHAEFGATGWADYVGKCRDKIPALMARLDQVLA